MAFESIEPFGGVVEDYRMGSLLTMVGAALSGPQSPPPPPPLHHFPWHAKAAAEPLVLDPDDQVAAFDRIFGNR